MDLDRAAGMVAWLVKFGQTEEAAIETVRLLASDDPADVAEMQAGIGSILDRLAHEAP